ncbi:hypothetical protein AV530_014852 [Patagioenas fasciata monilis]|uniref:Uncharacterized protein n=1 Tax=Patagioenas fasciata monilis TaxID=372326 RepID=A0A1V4L0N4_PATFA|nr:hypothetical protein AV530_014852 [Patagioenas fasciata monilis]
MATFSYGLKRLPNFYTRPSEESCGKGEQHGVVGGTEGSRSENSLCCACFWHLGGVFLTTGLVWVSLSWQGALLCWSLSLTGTGGHLWISSNLSSKQ